MYDQGKKVGGSVKPKTSRILIMVLKVNMWWNYERVVVVKVFKTIIAFKIFVDAIVPTGCSMKRRTKNAQRH
jgi:hypothetical protein